MPDTTSPRLKELQDAFAFPELDPLLVLMAMLLLGGILAMYIRFLYLRSSPQTSGDSIAKVFPLLTVVTIAVIAVVKSSLALSLGLVGALSIVRFRAAIKDPLELVYLFLCIAVGLSLGAVQVWLAVALVVVATIFVLVFDRMKTGAGASAGYLSVVGARTPWFESGGDNALALVKAQCPNLSVERCDVDGAEGQLRVFLPRVDANAAPGIVATLCDQMPECQVSFVNAERLP